MEICTSNGLQFRLPELESVCIPRGVHEKVSALITHVEN